jgi:hypothetical protein
MFFSGSPPFPSALTNIRQPPETKKAMKVLHPVEAAFMAFHYKQELIQAVEPGKTLNPDPLLR